MQKILALLVLLTGCMSVGWGKVMVTVWAGEFDRKEAIVNFSLPPGSGYVDKVRDPAGRLKPLQVDEDGQAWFVVDELRKGEQRTYELVGGPTDMPVVPIEAKREGAKVRVKRANGVMFEYQGEPSELPRADIDPVFQRGAYIHPVSTPRGKVVTDHYPPNHLHQDGIFMAWTMTEFQGRKPDFWNLKEKKGKVEFAGVEKTWGGPVEGGFRAKHRFVDLTGEKPMVVLDEVWVVRAYSTGFTGLRNPYWVFDMVSTQKCAGIDALKLPKYHYGGFGFRGNWAWNGKDACTMLTSEGETDREKGNGKPGRWCDVWGSLDGAEVGIAIMGHPQNFRAPQPLRLHPTEPYISFAPQVAGPFEIKPGEEYVSQYRFVVHDGKPDKAELDRLWNDYAHPVKVRINEQ